MKKIKTKTAAVMLMASLAVSAAVFPVFASDNRLVYLGGEPFGVKFYNDGVMIIDLEKFYNGEGYVCPAEKGGLRIGDVIKEINGNKVTANEEVMAAIAENSGETVEMSISRQGEALTRNITPEKNMTGLYLLGAWIRDSCAGIGTITYYAGENNCFAALGHGICDTDTGEMMPLGNAEIVHAEISSVTKSVAGNAGSLNGFFTGKTEGDLTKNTPIGVYGTIFDNNYKDKSKIEIADFDEIKTGKAEIYSTISGHNPEKFEAEITKVLNGNPENNENFVIKVTDERLLGKCGGIVQGMSGSPIVQDGKLVGAVTHVFINNTDEGYGVSARFMLSNYEKV